MKHLVNNPFHNFLLGLVTTEGENGRACDCFFNAVISRSQDNKKIKSRFVKRAR